jgi:hypothetical protein
LRWQLTYGLFVQHPLYSTPRFLVSRRHPDKVNGRILSQNSKTTYIEVAVLSAVFVVGWVTRACCGKDCPVVVGGRLSFMPSFSST